MILIPQVHAVSWSSEIQLTFDENFDFSPSITQSKDGRIWVFFSRSTIGYPDIFYEVYNGTAWSADTQFTTNTNQDIQPSALTSSDGKIWVFWASNRNNIDYNIFYRRSLNNGSTWSSDTPLINYVGDDRCPSAMQGLDGRIWITWYTNRNGNWEIYYRYYDSTWHSDTRLTTNDAEDIEPTITQSQDGRIWVFWSSDRTGNYEIFYKTSSDNGVTWSNDAQLTFASGSTDGVPSAMRTQTGEIWVAWSADTGSSNWDIFYMVYNGLSWSGKTSLVSSSSIDDSPSLFQIANSTKYVAWNTDRNEDYDIYYKSSVADHDVAVTNVAPFSTRSYQGWPNTVQVSVKNFGQNVETFTVTIYYNSTPVETKTVSSLAPNTTTILTFSWNTSELSFGYYSLWAKASQVQDEEDLTDNTCLAGTIWLTIPGDVNGDKGIDIRDAAVLSAHWYPGEDGPFGPLNYDSNIDINGDSLIDIVDAGILSTHWGQSW
jgi:hypothetical protein